MLKLFKRDKLKDLPVFAIRGNHDCYYQKELLLNLSKKDPQWHMPDLYYTREVEVNDKGEKIGILMVDSCLLLCSNYSYGPINSPGPGHGAAYEHITKDELLTQARHQEIAELRDITCGDPWYREEGNRMYEWILKTVDRWAKDDKIIWKASVQHHPLFGKWYTDFEHLTNDYLPILMDHKFDLYLNGHEHCLEYAFYPYSQAPDELDLTRTNQELIKGVNAASTHDYKE